MLLLAACAGPHSTEGIGPTLRERFGELAFLTPIDAPPTVALVAGGSISSAASSCGACHTDHASAWGQATHASAVRDLQYLAELAKPGQPRWLCLNCHAPTAPQRRDRFTLDSRLMDGITRVESEPNPDHDAGRMGEGVGCATCHVRRDDDGAGVVVGPRGTTRAPHRVRVDRASLVGICVRCHSPTTPDGERIVISPTFPCWFETKQELVVATTGCTDCHMPRTTRPAASGSPPVDVAQHLWDGGGVPKSYAGYDGLLARGWRTGLDVRVEGRTVVLTNARAGHSLPTADPERFLRVDARLERAGAVVATDTLRIGQTWDWGDAATGRPAERIADTRLRGGETRTWSPNLPGEADTLVVEVAHVRLTAENAASMSGTVLDSELRALWPEAQGLLVDMAANYPMATWIYRQRIELATGEARVWAAEELIAASKDSAGRPR